MARTFVVEYVGQARIRLCAQQFMDVATAEENLSLHIFQQFN